MKNYKAMEKAALKLLQEKRILNYTNFNATRGVLLEILDNRNVYEVFLSHNNINEDECTCSDFSLFHTCRHIIAAEYLSRTMKWQRRIRNTGVFDDVHEPVKSRVQMYLEKLEPIQLQKIQQQIRVEKSELSLNIKIEISRNYYHFDHFLIRLSIGKNKKYIIKNIAQFLKIYFANGIYQLSSKQQIDFKYDLLSNQSHQFLMLLSTLISSSHYTSSKKELLITYKEINQILLFLKNSSIEYIIEFVTKGWRIDHIQFSNEIPLKAKLITDKKSVLLQTLSENIYLMPHSNLIYVDGYFYELNSVSTQLCQFFLDELSNNMFDLDEIDEIISKIIQQLSSVLNVINLNDYSNNKINDKPSIYLSKNDDNRMILEVTDITTYDYHYHLSKFLYDWNFEQLDTFKYISTNINSDWLYRFFTSGIRQLQSLTKVDIDNVLNNFIVEVDQINVDMSLDNSLLTVAFNIDGIKNSEIIQLLNSIEEKKSFHTFNDGRIVSLQDEVFNKVHHVLNNIRGTYKLKDNQLQLKKANVLSIASEIDSSTTNQLDELIQDLKYPEYLNVNIPKTLKTQLKDYQIYGFKWLKMLSKHGLGGILADEMGLGKTIQSIAYILSELEESHFKHKKFLIIAPASLVYNWEFEFKKFAPNIDVTVLVGDDHKKSADVSYSEASVIITSYQSFRIYEKIYKQKNWHTIILDESQMIKNHTTKLHRSLRDFQINTIFALSGTPIENRKEEFWSVFALILPGLFPPLKDYKKLSESQILKISRPFILRRLKKDVLDNLPDKNEIVLYNDLDKQQKLLYLGYLDKMQQTISKYSNDEIAQHHIEILSGLTRLRQICCHPSLFIDNYEGKSGKYEQFLNLILEKLESGNRILVFSQFSSMLLLLQNLLNTNQIDSLMLTGQTPTKKRKEMVDQFNNKTINVFLISLKAGGTGLNLTSADTVILYDLWWNPAVEDQAMSRAHRIGQTKDVTVYRMVSKGTIEENILKLQQQKKELFNRVISNETEKFMQRNQLSADDIKEILGMSK